MKTIQYLKTNKLGSSFTKSAADIGRAFLVSWALMRALALSTFHPFTLLTFIAYLLLNKQYKRWLNAKNPPGLTASCATVLAAILSILTLLAEYETLLGDLQSLLFKVGHLIICGLGFFFLGKMTIHALLIYGRTLSLSQASICSATTPRPQEKSVFWRYFPGFGFLLSLLGQLPFLLTNYPGIMTVDSLNQYGQIIGELPLSNHHPWIHTVFMGFLYHIGLSVTGSINGGIFFITFTQMLICSGIIAFMIFTLQQLFAKKYVLWICLLIFVLLPYHGIYAVTLWKDILFSYMVLLFTIMLTRILLLRPGRMAALIDAVLYILSAMAMCLLRSNGWYAYLLCIPFLFIIFRENWKRQLPIQLVIIVSVLLIRGPLTDELDIKQPDFVEALSLPIQMTARVYAENEPVDQTDHDMWNRIMDTSKIAETYDPHCSDSMKNLIRFGDQEYLSENRKEYGILWLRFGLRHPGAYLRGYIDETKGYWYPGITNETIGLDECIAQNPYGLSATPLLSGNIYIKIKEILFKLYTMVPIYGLLWSAGAGFWLFLLLAAKTISDKNTKLLLLFIPNAAVILTLLAATPVYNEFRYAYPLMVSLPFLFSVVFLDKPQEETTED